MKKILFTLLFVFSCAFLCSCASESVDSTETTAHEHTWILANCTTPKTCSECGATDGNANKSKHVYAEATCQTPKTCTLCGRTMGMPKKHSYEDYNDNELKCSVCGDIKEKVCEHEFDRVACEEELECKLCGKMVKQPNHEFLLYSCSEPLVCANCGIENENISEQHAVQDNKCLICKNIVYSGKGDDVITGIELDSTLYKMHFVNKGKRNIAVRVYDKYDDRDLLINDIGNYDGHVFIGKESPITIEITSYGEWEFELQQLNLTGKKSLSGKSDYVTNVFTADSNVFNFTHDGDHNFAVWAWSDYGRDLVINTIGNYDGKIKCDVPKGKLMFFEITADGNWSYEMVE